jgi:hypothetical protein
MIQSLRHHPSNQNIAVLRQVAARAGLRGPACHALVLVGAASSDGTRAEDSFSSGCPVDWLKVSHFDRR